MPEHLNARVEACYRQAEHFLAKGRRYYCRRCKATLVFTGEVLRE